MMRKVLKRNWYPLLGTCAADALGWYEVWATRSMPGSGVVFVLVAGYTLVLAALLLYLMICSAEVIRLTDRSES